MDKAQSNKKENKILKTIQETIKSYEAMLNETTDKKKRIVLLNTISELKE